MTQPAGTTDHRIAPRPNVPSFLAGAPAWKGNLLLFGLLVSVALAYFFWQTQSAQRAFLTYVREHSRMIAGVIELNARGALLSQDAVEKVLAMFLGNTARFVDYLDGVEPFSDTELAEFAAENGLAGIRIERGAGEAAQGPSDWMGTAEGACAVPDGDLRHLPARHLYYIPWPRARGDGCVVVGLTSREIETLQDRIGIDRLLASLAGLAGIHHVRVAAGDGGAPAGPVAGDPPATVDFREGSAGRIAEIRRPFGQDTLVVGLAAEPFFARTRQLWGEFLLFCLLLGSLGLFFSWLLHRNQTAYVNRIREVERDLAREREDAALGRSAAAIAHEIRNPLNAIGMGLQRIEMEAEGLGEDDRAMVATMRQALARADGIVENIRRFARALSPRTEPVRLGRLFGETLALYRGRCASQSIQVMVEDGEDPEVSGDPALLGQVADNLIKNGVEAQPRGGFLRIRTDRRAGEGRLRIENGGFALGPGEAERIMEPYFTTKTRGTGLGLAIVRRIVRAHGGRMAVSVLGDGEVRITVAIPLWREEGKGDHADPHR